ncbi:MAG: hypothetical protein E6R03_16465 [Hyphomicrobiaceae bacterium]|nr:MAG: hypothetical protein E6R03_16465 [Hyphomicrobiaceae bacterium]
MKELGQEMQKVFTEMVSSGALTKIIEENVQAAVGGVLHECFRDYSPFRKALVEHINQNLSVDFSALGFAGYYDSETRERVERLFKCEHPIFGAIATKGQPTAELAFALGVIRGVTHGQTPKKQ